MIAHPFKYLLGAGLLALAACADQPAPVTAPPAPPPAAAPAPAAPAISRGQALPIFFEPWSANLDEPAQGALSAAADLAKQHPNVPILVTGYADPEGPRGANYALSRLRARRVADFLIEKGVPARRIRTMYRGPQLDAGVESRRVMLTVDQPQRHSR
ncbi:OmpA family protein [Roseococcus sp. YIM B11640]|uniref:OmpA family protein n=1 Tax=Roseococcus sp. YIM B11640 TaxID=3133973 RepID=UPI003C7A9E33